MTQRDRLTRNILPKREADYRKRQITKDADGPKVRGHEEENVLERLCPRHRWPKKTTINKLRNMLHNIKILHF